MDIERDHVALTGTWQQLDEHPDQEVWRPEVAEKLGPWSAFELPGALAHWSERERNIGRQCAWLRRTFPVSEEQAGRQAVLRWGGIRFGATAWINGVRVGAHPTIGPARLLVPPGTTREGGNEIVIRVDGWGALPKSDNGTPLIPVGADLHWGARSMSAYDDVWLEFYRHVYMKWILAVPDLEDGAVALRVWFDGAEQLPERVELQARCLLPEGGLAGAASANASTADAPTELRVPLREVHPWTPRDPFLYRAEVQTLAEGRVCDEVAFRFGLREVGVQDGHYGLNGRPLWLRGSNLVHEWTWWDSPFNREVKRYLVDEARNMNLNCFRTHTLPPNAHWLDVSDEHGMMILAEFPTTINYRDMGFTDEQREVWHRNVLLDATGWMTKIWNHPAVVMWVLTNESARDNAWEAGPFHQHVAGLDPTRPTLRTGETEVGTPDAVDVHTCGNYSYGPNKDSWATCRRLAENKDPERALGNSEYMNYFDSDEDRRRRRLGDPRHPGAALDYAECAAEDTEMMRRLEFDLILPYMYAGWPRFRGNDWRADYPTPMAAALHSAMAPVLPSLELLDRNFVAGRRVTTPLHLINELHRPVEAQLTLCITPQNPLFVPDEDALAAAVWQEEHALALPAGSHEVNEATWPVPDQEGTYYLTAVLRRDGDAPVASQRTVRAMRDPAAQPAPEDARIAVVGRDEELETLLERHRLATLPPSPEGLARASAVLAWDPAMLESLQRNAMAALSDAVEHGARLVIVQPQRGINTDLVTFTLGDMGDGWEPRSSRVFPYPDADHPMLAGIRPDCLLRWNGFLGVIVDHNLGGPAVEEGARLLWAERPARPVAVAVRHGEGEIVILTLRLRGRLNPSADAYDPCAEQILLNLTLR